MKNVSIRLEEELHKKVRLKCFEDEISIQQYVVALIREDLGIKNKQEKKTSEVLGKRCLYVKRKGENSI